MDEIETRLAARLSALRAERGWSLDELAKRSSVSRWVDSVIMQRGLGDGDSNSPESDPKREK